MKYDLHGYDEIKTSFLRMYWSFCITLTQASAIALTLPFNRAQLVAYTYEQFADVYEHPTEKLILELVALGLSFDDDSLLDAHRKAVSDILRDYGLAALIGPLTSDEQDDLMRDLTVLGFIPR